MLKPALGYDDSLDVFGVHGVGGAWGALAVGLFAWSGGAAGEVSIASQVPKQLASIAFTAVFCSVATLAILYILRGLFGDLRVTEENEFIGLDLSEHSEGAYTEVG
jgi:Amt family ammonium transporter